MNECFENATRSLGHAFRSGQAVATLRAMRRLSSVLRTSYISSSSESCTLPFLAAVKGIPNGLAAQKISQSTMEKHSEGKKDTDQLRKQHNKEFSAAERVSHGIMPHILNLYGSCATSRDFEIYSPDATFEDPLMRANGVKQIKSAFYSLSKVFSESRIVEYNIKENVISPGKHEILIDNKQYYKFLGKGINMISIIKLYVEGEKVVRHEDWWDKKPLLNRETVKLPLAGRFIEMARRGSMLTTHVIMRFGKDPTI